MTESFWLELGKEVIKYVAIAGVGGAIAAYLLKVVEGWRKTRQERFSELLDKILKTTEMTADQYVEKLELIGKLDKETQELRSKVRELDNNAIKLVREREQDAQKIQELITHRGMREERISHLEEDVGNLKTQVFDWETKYNSLKEKYNKAIEILVGALDKANIPVPDELKVLLGDSITKFTLKGKS